MYPGQVYHRRAIGETLYVHRVDAGTVQEGGREKVREKEREKEREIERRKSAWRKERKRERCAPIPAKRRTHSIAPANRQTNMT